MCGILGSINVKETAKHLDSIKHRGPDAFGKRSFNIGDNEITLLHRRLSIVDLSDAGNQPMISENQKGCIIFNGEIYNHLELKETLTEFNFRGHSDTETILNYFVKYKVKDVLKNLNGIFAFAFLDLQNGLLHLARDRFGVKPLYYFASSEQMIFASEIRPIQQILNQPFNEGIIASSLFLRYTPSPHTVYNQIQKVQPGQVITVDLNGNTLNYNKNHFVSPPKSIGTYNAEKKFLVREYGFLLEKAVDRQLMADVEVGVFLSGGIDSALIAAVARQRSNSKVKAFTIGFEGNAEGIDEIDYAKQTAQVLGLDHFCARIGFSDFMSSLSNIIRIVEEPIGTTSIIPMYSLSAMAAAKVKVVLSGQGADEPLGGYRKYRALPWLNKARFFKFIYGSPYVYRVLNIKSENIRRFLSALKADNFLDSYLNFNSVFSKSQLKDLINPTSAASMLDSVEQNLAFYKANWDAQKPDISNAKDLFLYYDTRTSLADDLLMYTDKITMNFSVECRVPLLDNDLVRFIESLDCKHKFNSTTGKIIHKEFAKEYLPSFIIERRKLGFKSPTSLWFKEQKEQLAEMFNSGTYFRQIFNIEAVINLLEEHASGRNLEKQIFLLLNFHQLLERENTTALIKRCA